MAKSIKRKKVPNGKGKRRMPPATVNVSERECSDESTAQSMVRLGDRPVGNAQRFSRLLQASFLEGYGKDNRQSFLVFPDEIVGD